MGGPVGPGTVGCRASSEAPLRGAHHDEEHGGILARPQAEVLGEAEPRSTQTGSTCRSVQSVLIRGSPGDRSIRSEIAQTSASTRSGERPLDRPPSPKSAISSSSAGKAPTWCTRPCS